MNKRYYNNYAWYHSNISNKSKTTYQNMHVNAGPILESKGIHAIFQKKGRKKAKIGKIFENLGKNVHNFKIF